MEAERWRRSIIDGAHMGGEFVNMFSSLIFIAKSKKHQVK